MRPQDGGPRRCAEYEAREGLGSTENCRERVSVYPEDAGRGMCEREIEEVAGHSLDGQCVDADSLNDALGADAAGLRVEGWGARGPAADVELDRAEGSLVPLDRHAQRGQEPLGGVEVHHDSLVGLHVLTTGGERLGIEAEVEDDLLGRRGDPAEIGVRRKRRGIVNDDLGRLLLLGIRSRGARSLFRSSRGPISRSKCGAAGGAGVDHEERGNGALSFPPAHGVS